VSTLASGGPADKAGLKLGDVVTEVNGAPIPTRDQFCAYSANAQDTKTITTPAGTFETDSSTASSPRISRRGRSLAVSPRASPKRSCLGVPVANSLVQEVLVLHAIRA
jgi:membrane-associated protease RseP (regulator of RpoE activity)